MRLAAAFGLLPELCLVISTGLFPTILTVWRSPSLLFQPRELSRFFMSKVWNLYGNGVDGNAKGVKQTLITPHAYGVVLDIGAGHGHTINYLEHSRITKYIAVEPNTYMHAELRRTASAAGYTEDAGTLLILPCGAEDISTILSYLPAPHPPIDTLISVLTICSIPSPQSTITSLITEVLKPGGQVLYYEHVLSDRKDVAWWQWFWTPLWSIFFGGCHLDRQTHRWIEDVGGWVRGEGSVWRKEGENDETLFWYRAGRLVKAE
ncbi:S-adenosyl-L-methionine-dependent methyltransferase [Suillus ampliporus]|nr:S-adenosyl-L-methionine-dependent methyltransferase [Suillus ampliporus]